MAFKGVSCPFTCVTRLAWARSHSHLNWVDIEHVPKVLPRFEDHLTKLSLGGRRYKSVSATTLHYFRGGPKVGRWRFMMFGTVCDKLIFWGSGNLGHLWVGAPPARRSNQVEVLLCLREGVQGL